jgi:uncharacterized protein (TIGR02996 family)
MSTLKSLLLATRFEPDEDAPRLVLADWLEESGTTAYQALAEFIRIQCQLARLPDNHPERADLEWRQRRLWWDHVETWLGPVYEASREFLFRRGFARVELYAGCIPDNELRSFLTTSAWNWIDALHWISPTARHLEELLQAPAFSSLVSLHLQEGPPIDRAVSLLSPDDSPLPLRELRLTNCSVDRAALNALIHWPQLSELRRLDLQHNHLRGRDLDVLAQSHHFPRLESLNLRSNLLADGWTDKSLNAFLDSSLLTGLRHLGLGYNRLRNRLDALLTSPRLAGLVELDLAGNMLEDEQAILLATSPHYRSLRHLNLSNNEIGVAGITALSASEYLDRLEVLDLRDNLLVADSLWALIRAPHLRGLQRLRLNRLAYNSYPLLSRLRGRFGHCLEMD